MDSDSSLDENFETRGEVAARIGRTRSNTSSPQEGNSESDSSGTSDEEEERKVPREAPGAVVPNSPAGESNSVLSHDDDEDDAQSQSSYTSSSSVGRPRDKENANRGGQQVDKQRSEDEEGSSKSREVDEEGECSREEGFGEDSGEGEQPPADLSDVSDMDSRDSLEAVFAQDCKVKGAGEEGPSASPAGRVASREEADEYEEGEDVEEEEVARSGPCTPPGLPTPTPPPPPPSVLYQPSPEQPILDTEQLDFEVEEQVKETVGGLPGGEEDREEGECEEPRLAAGRRMEEEEKSDGELKEGEDLEEGEVSDEDEARPGEMEPRPVCRFYNRGQCTWGSSCRFVHPGVTDKGNYTMFELPRALLPVNGPPVYSPDYRIPYEKTFQPVALFQAPRKEEVVPVFESAWERGLRHAKEMMRKATKRKEMDIDFEEKKMNLSLGQEELDKENDYYTRPASPIVQSKEDPDHWSYEDPVDLYHPVGTGMSGASVAPVDVRQPHHHHHGHPGMPPAGVAGGGDYWRRVHYEGVDARSLRVEAEYVGRSNERKDRTRESRDLHRHHHHHHHHVVGEPPAHGLPSRGDHHHRHHGTSAGGAGGGEKGGGRDALAEGGRGGGVGGGRKKVSSSGGHLSVSRTGANAIPLPQLPPEKTSAAAVAAAWSREDKYSGISPSVPHSQKARGDEWADPWMRSKSPTRRALAPSTVPTGAPVAATMRSSRRHRHSFSSGSSYSSSSSSSRSSSRSSYSSFSSPSPPRPTPAPTLIPPSSSSSSGAPVRQQQQQRHAHQRHPPLPPPEASSQQAPSANHHHHAPSAPAPQRPHHHHHHHHHHRSSGVVMSSPVAPRTPPSLAPQGTHPPVVPSAKSRSRSPLSRAHPRRRVSTNSLILQQPVLGVASGGGGRASGQLPPLPPPASSPRVNALPPGRKVGRTAALSPPGGSHGERKVSAMVMGASGGYNLPPPPAAAAALLTASMRSSQGALVREPSPQLVRKALHATASIPMPQPSPRIMGTTRAPQAAVAVAAAAAKSATESSSRHHHRRRHHHEGGRRRRSSTSRRSPSSRSSRSDDDLSEDEEDDSASGSSSDSSDSSGSSTSSSSSTSSTSSDASGEAVKKATSPQVRPKRFMMDERATLANSMKVKAMDALKLSGQKQQIKLTLKAPGSNLVSGKRPMLDMPEPLVMRNRDRPMNFPLMAGKKRSAPDSPSSPTDTAQPSTKVQLVMGGGGGMVGKASAKKAPSRREELLKQLKAVEDAIARKRSKITFPGTS